MPDSDERQPNKPGGELKEDDRPAEDLPAVENQASVKPDDYPPGSDGKPEPGVD